MNPHCKTAYCKGCVDAPAETREHIENPPVSLELTGDESDAIADMLKIALDDQMDYHDSGRMREDATGVDFLNLSVKMKHVSNVLMRMGKAYTSGMFQALSNDLASDATEAKGEPSPPSNDGGRTRIGNTPDVQTDDDAPEDEKN